MFFQHNNYCCLWFHVCCSHLRTCVSNNTTFWLLWLPIYRSRWSIKTILHSNLLKLQNGFWGYLHSSISTRSKKWSFLQITKTFTWKWFRIDFWCHSKRIKLTEIENVSYSFRIQILQRLESSICFACYIIAENKR